MPSVGGGVVGDGAVGDGVDGDDAGGHLVMLATSFSGHYNRGFSSQL